MINSVELHQEANRLRQEKKYAEALQIYEKVWPETRDQYDGAGLLSCLRKLKKYDRAIPLALEMVEKFPAFQWGKNEAIWTLISGRLNRLHDNVSLGEVLEVAIEIMRLDPEDLASKMVVFKVLKTAKNVGEWEIVCEWVEKLKPENLSTEPMTDEKGREGWCDQSLWYNYKAKGLIETGKAEEIFQFIDEAIVKHPRQKKFFLRLKALSLYRLGNLNESEECYKSLCNVRQPDWWLLHEYSKVIRDKGDKNEALRLMCQAAISHKKLETMVTLFKEMGLLYNELGKKEIARAHFALSSLVRCEKGWSLPEIIPKSISEINLSLGNDNSPSKIKEALGFCRQEWEAFLGLNKSRSTSKRRKPTKGLTGKVVLGSAERPFCFIKDDGNGSYFCLKSDLPEGIADGEAVYFTALPSFDKKKKRESWKAVNIIRYS